MSPLTEPTKLILKKDSVAATDVNIREVSLLLHGNGTNGSTTIVDSSLNPKTVTAVGNAQISTAQSKFGGSSLYFDGNGDWLTIPSNIDFSFGTGDFTAEYWINWITVKEGENHVQIGGSANVLGTTTGGKLEYYANGASRIVDSVAATTGSWIHIALVRLSGQTRLFKNGGQIGNTYSDSNNYVNSEMRLFARTDNFSQGVPLYGYVDELRITKGVARYTSNFTPPTAPFPDF